ncbi:unknown protein [Seminavis robusta]|uniref:Uncharacterized protein n=1 Tax=Seminavis robusta TaxID=568900 RepID=A0A9N8DT57_9STRA|nr:unknown protein [Seminavis robusta]|eukprot:Sro232_g094070.1 n/a (144) ;mRNA; r:82744-83175
MAENGHEYIGMMKTATKYYPNKEIAKTMEEWPSESSLVLECESPITGGTLHFWQLITSTTERKSCASLPPKALDLHIMEILTLLGLLILLAKFVKEKWRGLRLFLNTLTTAMPSTKHGKVYSSWKSVGLQGMGGSGLLPPWLG